MKPKVRAVVAVPAPRSTIASRLSRSDDSSASGMSLETMYRKMEDLASFATLLALRFSRLVSSIWSKASYMECSVSINPEAPKSFIPTHL